MKYRDRDSDVVHVAYWHVHSYSVLLLACEDEWQYTAYGLSECYVPVLDDTLVTYLECIGAMK